MSDFGFKQPEFTNEEIRELKEVAQGEIKKKRKTVGKAVGYIAGSVALFAVAAKVIPMAMDTISAKLYKRSVKKDIEDDDDWGPEIVKNTRDEED